MSDKKAPPRPTPPPAPRPSQPDFIPNRKGGVVHDGGNGKVVNYTPAPTAPPRPKR